VLPVLVMLPNRAVPPFELAPHRLKGSGQVEDLRAELPARVVRQAAVAEKRAIAAPRISLPRPHGRNRLHVTM
jgi:hypothetical protein